jgi:ribosomal protein uL24
MKFKYVCLGLGGEVVGGGVVGGGERAAGVCGVDMTFPPQPPLSYCSADVTSSRRKVRKAVFTAGSEQRRKLMSARLDKDLVEQYGVRSIPVRKGDEVKIVRGKQASRDGKVVGVFRKHFVIYVERVVRTKANQQEVPIPIAPSNVVITKLEMNPSRERILARKREGRAAAKARLATTD